MTWFKVDDSLPDHPKMLRLQAKRGWQSALALWTLAGAWSSKHLTDGEVPSTIVPRLGCTKRDAELLVECGLWTRLETGYLFHDWSSRNPLRKDVEAKREKTRAKVSEWRRNQPRNEVTEKVSNPAPVPTRPDPTNLPSLRSGGEREDARPSEHRRADLSESGVQPTVDVLGLQMALGKVADELGWDSAPEVANSQLAKAAKRVAGIASRRGLSRDDAATELCRKALLLARATGKSVAFALLEVDTAAPTPRASGGRTGGRMAMAPGTTHEDFADAEPMEVQLARLRGA